MGINFLYLLLFFLGLSIIYHFLPSKLRPYLLLAASSIFYLFFFLRHLVSIIILIFVNYLIGLAMYRQKGYAKKILFYLGIAFNCIVFYLHKYLQIPLSDYYFLEADSPIPVGISFSILQFLSYSIEIFRNRLRPEKSLIFFSLYIIFFPIVIAGPVERPRRLINQLRNLPGFDTALVSEGLKLIVLGLFKKFVIGERLALFVDAVYASPDIFSGSILFLTMVMYSIQLYCDFSGYSNIVSGMARILGIKLADNFRLPYFALSIADFWNRWHISFSAWLKDYIYIPLGGNKVPFARWMVNVGCVFLVSSIWHGARITYIIWGLIYAMATIAEKTFFRFVKNSIFLGRLIWEFRIPLRVLRYIINMLIIIVAWGIFRSPSLSVAGVFVSRSLYAWHWTPFFQFSQDLYSIMKYENIVICLISIFVLFVFELILYTNLTLRSKKLQLGFASLFYYLLAAGVIFFGEFGSKFQFIYSKF